MNTGTWKREDHRKAGTDTYFHLFITGYLFKQKKCRFTTANVIKYTCFNKNKFYKNEDDRRPSGQHNVAQSLSEFAPLTRTWKYELKSVNMNLTPM